MAVQQTNREPPHVVVRGSARSFLQEIVSGSHSFRADEPESAGGTNAAPDPYDYVLAGLGACTSMMVGLYARQRKWPLESVSVYLWHSRIHARDCDECQTKEGMLDRVDIDVELAGNLTPEQHAMLMDVAAKCPVHRTVTSEINIRVRLFRRRQSLYLFRDNADAKAPVYPRVSRLRTRCNQFPEC